MQVLHSVTWCPPHAPTLSFCSAFWGAGVPSHRPQCFQDQDTCKADYIFTCLKLHTHLAVGSIVTESFGFIKLRFGPEPRLGSKDMTRPGPTRNLVETWTDSSYSPVAAACAQFFSVRIFAPVKA